MDMIKTGALIAKRRRALGYSQDKFGEIIGVSGKAVSKWERGLSAPDVSLMSRLAVELKISLAQLLDGADTDPALSSNALSNNIDSCELSFDSESILSFSESDSLGIVSPYLFGNNLEHTRSCISGGLSAQMLKNRKFIGKPSAMEGVAQGWYVIGDSTYCCFSAPYTHHYKEHYHMRRRLECNAQQVNALDGELSGIGQHEICVCADDTYAFAIVLKSDKDTAISVSLTDRYGKQVYASHVINVKSSDSWARYTAELTPELSDTDADVRITFTGTACVDIGCVSLMNKNNFRGMRLDVIEAMKEIGIKLLRWPGGNFAGEYNWFDGLLPVDERAPLESYQHLETQPHTLGYDFHEISTDDFIALCKEIGAEPFITINLAWNTPEENAAWVEYCNGDIATTYGKIRAERGNPDPYNVMLWSLGNEFGYGHMEGDNSATGYSHLARENGLKMLEVCSNLTFCSSGPYPNREWVEYSLKPLSSISNVVSLHFYAEIYKNNLIAEIEESYGAALASVGVARQKVRKLRESIGNDKIKISFDEWNVWYGWYRSSCVTDGIFTALMMSMIIGEAKRSGIEFACQFEAVNESAIKVTKSGASLSATGQALSLMSVHSGGTLIHADDCTVATRHGDAVSATVINPSYDTEKCVYIDAKGKSPRVTLYEGKSLLPHNKFEICDISVNTSDNKFKIQIPPHSIAKITY